jgi:hypothetical protein
MNHLPYDLSLYRHFLPVRLDLAHERDIPVRQAESHRTTNSKEHDTR